jgi:hypothetical protein
MKAFENVKNTESTYKHFLYVMTLYTTYIRPALPSSTIFRRTKP